MKKSCILQFYKIHICFIEFQDMYNNLKYKTRNIVMNSSVLALLLWVGWWFVSIISIIGIAIATLGWLISVRWRVLVTCCCPLSAVKRQETFTSQLPCQVSTCVLQWSLLHKCLVPRRQIVFLGSFEIKNIVGKLSHRLL